LATLGAFLVLESGAHAQARRANRLARVTAVLSDRSRRNPGDIVGSLDRMWGQIANRLQPGKAAVISGATGALSATAEERRFLEKHRDVAVRATGTYVGHGFDAQFPMNVSLAALALSHGRIYPPGDDSGVERPMDGPLTQVVVTSVGHWRGEGLGLIEAAA